MIPQINFIVVDVIVVALLIALLVVGIFKGVKHTLINIALLAVSIAVGFISYTNVVKLFIVDLLSDWINVTEKVALTTEAKMGLSITYMFMASLILTLLVYLLLRLIKLLIMIIVKRKTQTPRKPKKVVSRVFGGLISLVSYGVLLIASLSLVDNSMIGLNKTIDETYVTKYVSRADNMLLEALDKKDLNVEGCLILVALQGDYLAKNINQDTVANLMEVMEVLGNNTIIPAKFSETNAQEVVDQLNALLTFEKTFLLTETKGDSLKLEPLPAYKEFMALSNDVVIKALNKMATERDGEEKISGIENSLNLSNLLKDICGDTASEVFDSIVTLQ